MDITATNQFLYMCYRLHSFLGLRPWNELPQTAHIMGTTINMVIFYGHDCDYDYDYDYYYDYDHDCDYDYADDHDHDYDYDHDYEYDHDYDYDYECDNLCNMSWMGHVIYPGGFYDYDNDILQRLSYS